MKQLTIFLAIFPLHILFGAMAGDPLIVLSSSKPIARLLRTALGLDPCNPNNHQYDLYARQYGYTSWSETPHCKAARFIFGDNDDD